MSTPTQPTASTECEDPVLIMRDKETEKKTDDEIPNILHSVYSSTSFSHLYSFPRPSHGTWFIPAKGVILVRYDRRTQRWTQILEKKKSLMRNLQRYRIPGVQNFHSNQKSNCAQNRAICAQNRAIDIEPNPKNS